MHWPPLYKHVHKHHHRNTFPARGYIDGANEHPLEQLIALSLHWIALYIVAYTTGLHVAAVAAHLLLKAAGACFNHTGYDLRLNFLGIDYSVRAHEMHHRHPQKNFAQYVMFWDRLMVFVFAHPTHFSHMSHPTFPISHNLIFFSGFLFRPPTHFSHMSHPTFPISHNLISPPCRRTTTS